VHPGRRENGSINRGDPQPGTHPRTRRPGDHERGCDLPQPTAHATPSRIELIILL